MNILEKILGGVAAPVVDYFKRRMELKAEDRQQERAVQKALAERKIELIAQGLTADMNWEMEFAQQARTSWKDEYTLLVVSTPAILSFIKLPWLDGPAIVREGFKALEATPVWYQGVFVTMFLATVGIRYWRRTQSDT